MTGATPARSDAWAVLRQLLCGQVAAADHLANSLRVEAYGCTTFGRTDAIDLFAADPLALSGAAQVLVSPQAIAVLDQTADGRTVGAFADLIHGVVARLWVIAATTAGATAEPAVAVARDDFMSQLRQQYLGDAIDHPQLQAGAWPHVLEFGNAALGALQTLQTPPQLQPAFVASSSQVWVMRAFSSGPAVAALYRLRVQANMLPRHAHDRLALAVGDVQGQGQSHGQGAQLHPRLALSDPLPESTPVSF